MKSSKSISALAPDRISQAELNELLFLETEFLRRADGIRRRLDLGQPVELGDIDCCSDGRGSPGSPFEVLVTAGLLVWQHDHPNPRAPKTRGPGRGKPHTGVAA